MLELVKRPEEPEPPLKHNPPALERTAGVWQTDLTLHPKKGMSGMWLSQRKSRINKRTTKKERKKEGEKSIYVMLSSRSVLCWLTDTVATRRQVEPSKSTVAPLPQAPGIPSPCSAQAGPTCSKRPSVTLGHWAFQFIRCSSCHVMKPQGTLEGFQLKLNKNKLSGRNEHVPAVKHLY